MNPLSIVPGILHSDDPDIEFVHEQCIIMQKECIFMHRNGKKELLAEITTEEMRSGISKEKLREIGERYEKFRRG